MIDPDEEEAAPGVDVDEDLVAPAGGPAGGYIARNVARRLTDPKRKRDLIVGVFGRRGSGKSTFCKAAAIRFTEEIGRALGKDLRWDVWTRCTFGFLEFMRGYDMTEDPGVLIAEQWNVMMDARESMKAPHQMINHTVEMSRPYRQALLINMPIARMVDRNISGLLDVVVEVTNSLGWAKWFEYETDPLEGLRIAGRRRRVRLRYPTIKAEDGEMYTIAGTGDSPGSVYFGRPPDGIVSAYDEKRAKFTESIRFETYQAARWGQKLRVAEMLELARETDDGVPSQVLAFREAAERGDEDAMIVALDRLFPHRELRDWDVRRVVRILHPPADSGAE